MSKEIRKNQVTLSGEIISNFEFSHERYGEGFYTAMLSSERLSGEKDIIPIMVSERFFEKGEDWTGRLVGVHGQLRSYRKADGRRRRLELSVFARAFEQWEEIEYLESLTENKIFLDGYICKPPIYRKTPFGGEIADILLAVNRKYGKSDYIPCISWGRNARFAIGLEIGTRLQIDGRIQSREYQKRISDDECETRMAYEVSASKLTAVEEKEE